MSNNRGAHYRERLLGLARRAGDEEDEARTDHPGVSCANSQFEGTSGESGNPVSSSSNTANAEAMNTSVTYRIACKILEGAILNIDILMPYSYGLMYADDDPISDQLLKAAKRFAHDTGRSLTAIIEDALRHHLSRRLARPPRTRVTLTTVSGQGVRPGVDLDDSASFLTFMEEPHGSS